MFADDLTAHASSLVSELRKRGLTIATAESCTGGLLAGLITEIPGASDVFERGYVAYSNDAKIECLDVYPEDIVAFGAVSDDIAKSMASGAREKAGVDIAISVTGIAGPGGASPGKSVGLVYIGMALKGSDAVAKRFDFGDIGRSAVRAATIAAALQMIAAALPKTQVAGPAVR